MIDVRAELRKKWQDASDTPRAGYEWRGVVLQVDGPVRFVAAVREPDDRIALLIEAPLQAALASPYRAVADGLSVTDQRRPDEGIFRIAVVLELDEVREVFEVLAADIVEVASRAPLPQDAIAEAVRRLEAWQACLRVRRRRLSTESQFGLIGELILLQFLGAELGYRTSVHAWQGPLQGIHDFSRSGMAIEVKAVVGNGNWLRISRFSQLDATGLSALAVARPRLQESANGTSLVDSVREIREAVGQSEPTALAEFNERLIRAGYLDFDAPLYASFRFVLHDLCWFRVLPGFPRLTAASVPEGIVDGTYVIDERSIAAFQMDASGVREFLESMREPLHA